MNLLDYIGVEPWITDKDIRSALFYLREIEITQPATFPQIMRSETAKTLKSYCREIINSKKWARPVKPIRREKFIFRSCARHGLGILKCYVLV